MNLYQIHNETRYDGDDLAKVVSFMEDLLRGAVGAEIDRVSFYSGSNEGLISVRYFNPTSPVRRATRKYVKSRPTQYERRTVRIIHPHKVVESDLERLGLSGDGAMSLPPEGVRQMLYRLRTLYCKRGEKYYNSVYWISDHAITELSDDELPTVRIRTKPHRGFFPPTKPTEEG